MLVCRCCKREIIIYQGKGRPKLYCERCRGYVRAEYLKNYHNNYTRDKKKYNQYHRNYQKQNGVPNKPKQTNNHHRWAVNNWRYIELDGVGIWIRCDAYSVWWRLNKKKQKQYQQRYQEKYRDKPLVKQKQKDFHREHRDKYHRGSDMGLKAKRYPSGDLNLKNERQVIDNEFKRLGLRKERER